jgi:trimethylamine--corrinoid protein Co-methyltransferase
VAKSLADYQQPALDEGRREALEDYVARRKAAMPDAFV